MKNITANLWRILLTLATTFSITSSYSHTRWFQPPHLSMQRLINVTPTLAVTHAELSAPSNDVYRKTETLTLISYSDDRNIALQTVNTTTETLGVTGKLQGSAIYTNRITRDGLTGNMLLRQFGASNRARYMTAYDALGRVIVNESREFGVDGLHITTTTRQYALSATGDTITTRMVNGVKSEASYYTKTLKTDGLGRAQCETDSLHAANACLVQYQYNDLNQIISTTDLRGNTQKKTYNALGEVLSDSKTVHWLDTTQQSVSQTLTNEYQYDSVLNQRKMRTKGQLTGVPDEQTGWQIQQLDDVQQIINETDVAENNSQRNDEPNQQFVNQLTWDNFNDEISGRSKNSVISTANALAVTYGYDGLGEKQSATIKARENHPKGSDDEDQTIGITFHYGLNQQLTSKTVNNRTAYWHDYDSNNQRLAEYRRADVKGGWIHKLYQHPAGDPNTVTISRWLTEGEPLTAKNTQETDTLANVAGKLSVIKKVTADYTTTYGYNYQLGKINDRKKSFADQHVVEIKTHYNPDGSIDTQTNLTTDPQGITTATDTLHFNYYHDVQTHKIDLDKLQSKTDAAGIKTTYQYHGESVFTAVASDANVAIASMKNAYGALGEIIQTSHWRGKLGTNLVDRTHYHYGHAFNNLTDIVYDDEQTATGSRWINHIHYDYHQVPSNLGSPLTNHITRKTEYSSTSGDAWYSTDYGYNNRNEVSSVTQQRNNFVLGEQASNTTIHHFDALGNTDKITPKSIYTVGKTGMMIKPAASYQFTYNTQGELTQLSKDNQPTTLYYDNSDQGISDVYEGNLTTDDAGNHYTYNAENQQTSFSDKTKITHYTYGANDIRDGKYDDNTRLRYIYEGEHLLNTIEIKGKDKGAKVSYLGNNDARIIKLADGTVRVQFLQHDKRQSVVNNISDEGSVQTYHYNANGADTGGNAKQSRELDIRANPIQFSANHDQETQYNDYKIARYVRVFGGVLARFTTMDYGDKGLQLMNGYQLDGQNLLENSDRSGHMSGADAASIAIAAVVFVGWLFAIDEIVTGGAVRAWLGRCLRIGGREAEVVGRSSRMTSVVADGEINPRSSRDLFDEKEKARSAKKEEIRKQLGEKDPNWQKNMANAQDKRIAKVFPDHFEYDNKTGALMPKNFYKGAMPDRFIMSVEDAKAIFPQGQQFWCYDYYEGDVWEPTDISELEETAGDEYITVDSTTALEAVRTRVTKIGPMKICVGKLPYA